MELINTKLKNGLTLYAEDLEKPSIVPWLLGSFSALNGKKSLLELCSGNGAASFWCVNNGLYGRITLLDRRQNVLEVAQETIKQNRLQNIECVCTSVEDFRSSRKYDAVLCNPPFFAERSVSKDENLKAIRHEGSLTLDVLCGAVSKAIRQKGHFYLCHTPSRLIEIITTLNDYKFEIKRIRFCRHTSTSAPFLVLIDAVYLGGKGLTVMPDFIVQDQSGVYTDEMSSLCER
ncbi:MAG: methyltransferase [Oscillospiraceae bacterium]|nr:methyltransferase [Oscillospiraceae bacterium]MBR0452114.1 methyltransferase [Oscillospiraceae bacterium]